MSHRTCFRVSNITLLTSDNSVEHEIPKLVRNDNYTIYSEKLYTILHT